MKSSIEGIVHKLEAADRRQRIGRGNLLRGRFGGALLWLCCNLIALSVGLLQQDANVTASVAGSPNRSVVNDAKTKTESKSAKQKSTTSSIKSTGKESVAAETPGRAIHLSAMGCVAAGQGVFAILLLPAIMNGRAAGRKGPILRMAEILVWAMVGVVFMVAAAFSERIRGADIVIALLAGAIMFVPGAFLGCAAIRSSRQGRQYRAGHVSSAMAIAIVSIFGGLAALAVLARCSLAGAFDVAASLYPPALVCRIVDTGVSLPSLWTATGLLLWLVIVPYISHKYLGRSAVA